MKELKPQETSISTTKEPQLPVTWEDQMTAYAQAALEQEESVAAGAFISFSAGQISYAGNPVAGNKLHVVVVDSVIENCYYPEQYDRDSPVSPSCYAFGNDAKKMAPHPDAPQPQAQSCAECEWNKFGSDVNGKGKACKNIRRLALLPAEPVSPETLAKADFAIAKLPVMSVKNWAQYVRLVSTLRKRPPMGVVTTISTIPDAKSQFRVTLEHKSDLTQDLIGAVLSRRNEAKDLLVRPYPDNKEKPDKTPEPTKKRKY